MESFLPFPTKAFWEDGTHSIHRPSPWLPLRRRVFTLAGLREEGAHPMPLHPRMLLFPCIFAPPQNQPKPTQFDALQEMEAKLSWPRAPGTALTSFHSSLKDYLEFSLAGKVALPSMD